MGDTLLRRLTSRSKSCALCSMTVALSLLVISCSQPADTPDIESYMVDKVGELQAAHPNVPGFAVSVRLADGSMLGAATGAADPDGTPMTPATPVRIASITKSFVAATALRLVEDGELDLDAPISGLIDPVYDETLVGDGYDTNAITVRHLLMHVSGMPDHAGSRYAAMVMEDPTKVWTRADQLDVLVSLDDPLGPPNSRFKYSDTGYVLIGDIIERITSEPLHATVREEMKFTSIGLDQAWWDAFEAAPADAPERAHQYMDGLPTYGVHGSMDAYGGGGLITSTEELVLFYSALFSGEIFESPETLQLMTEAPGHPFPGSYRIGLFPMRTDGIDGFGHGGFWGTFAVYVPELDLTIAGVALDQSGYDDLRTAMREIVGEIASQQD